MRIVVVQTGPAGTMTIAKVKQRTTFKREKQKKH
jgi:hypothetical protein